MPGFGALIVGISAVFAVCCVALWRRSWHLFALSFVAGLMLSRWRIDLGLLTLRLDQLAVLSLAACLVAMRQPRGLPGSHRALRWLLLGYLAVGAVSGLRSPSPVWQVARSTALLGTSVIGFLLPSLLYSRGFALAQMARWVVGAAGIAGALATLSWLVSYLGGPTIGIQQDPTDPTLRLAYLTFFEANLLGAFLAASLVLAIFDQVSLRPWSGRLRRGAQIGIALGLLSTLTRGSWIACAAGLVVASFALRAGAAPSRHSRLLPKALSISLAVVVAIAMSATVRSVVSRRITDLFEFSTGSGLGRLRIMELALDEWADSPLIGHGFFSFAEHLPGSPADAQAWIPSLHLSLLHDTGLVGAATVTAFFLLLLWRLARRSPRGVAAPWMGVVVCLLVAGQATQAQILPFFWILLGMAAIAVDARGPATRPSPQLARTSA